MPLFGRRANSPNVANKQALANDGNVTGGAHGGNYGRRGAGTPFRFGAWLRLHGFDLITMALMGAIGLGVYFAPPAPNRSFPIYQPNGAVTYPQFAYPLRKEIIPIWLAALLAWIIPFIFFTLFQIRRRSLDDWLTTNMGLLKSLITAAVFQVFIKWLIGGLRPHFLAVCQPMISQGSMPSGGGFANLMYNRSVCTGNRKQINDSLESMPSGHSTAAWAGLFYLALYFNAQLKVMSAHNPAYWKMILFFAPILGACLISGSLTIDEFHNWYDVLAGAIIGICTAIVAFRQTFASVTDFRFNHLLLPRSTSFFHRSPFLPTANRGPFFDYQPMQEFASHDLPVSREGGWGYGGGEQFSGAPYDASAMNAGMMGGSGFGGNGAGMLGHKGGMMGGNGNGVLGHQDGTTTGMNGTGNGFLGHHNNGTTSMMGNGNGALGHHNGGTGLGNGHLGNPTYGDANTTAGTTTAAGRQNMV
ncbi:hypothetical protein D9619_005984 [Psilocybe cf. subviscida]|uniref:Phosphatidic acid phosphatase type 2/haloperoxidase domain-containing protein n=1 Tax=Psilocybe cf. subviscida TaxID=2480587 RepID=A0A8H5FB90_9AGAR|nr:hypothetical protein D9619_005984 [Psilocybe cf. subviscida]